MNQKKKIAFNLMIVLGVFLVIMLGVVFYQYLEEQKSGLLVTTELDEMKEELASDPQNKELMEEIREKDLTLRQEYFRNRERFQAAFYIMLGALVFWIISAKWYFSLALEYPPTSGDLQQEKALLKSEIENLESEAKKRKIRLSDIQAQLGENGMSDFYKGRIALMATIVGAVLIAALVILAFVGRGALEDIDWTEMAKKVDQSQMAEATDGDAETNGAGENGGDTPEPTPAAPETVELPEAEFSWPCLRGPGNLGIAEKGDYPDTWDGLAEENILWTTELVMPGNNSPIIWDDKIFLTGADGASRYVYAFNRADGEMLWESKLDIPEEDDIELTDIYPDTGYAASTAATDGRYVYAIFATGHLAAVDFDGNVKWINSFGRHESMYGYASSLLAHKGLVYVQWDHDDVDSSFIYGIKGETGEEVFKTNRPFGASWASPSIVPAESGDELVLVAPEWNAAYDPMTGKEKWRAEWYFCEPGPSPAWDGQKMYITCDGAELLAIKPGGSGTLGEDHIVWKADDGLPDTVSPVTAGDYVLQVAAGGYLTCFNTKDGSLLWEEFLPAGATASPIYVSDEANTIYLACNDGITRIFSLGDEYKALSEGSLDEPIYGTPAFVDNKIYIRSEGYLYAIGKQE
ncbi:MAG: PQQ-binding-like beta-propeller repeat protein [Candidatus Sumerlaeia bacterium]